MRISDWSSDVCSSDLEVAALALDAEMPVARGEGRAGQGQLRLRRQLGLPDPEAVPEDGIRAGVHAGATRLHGRLLDHQPGFGQVPVLAPFGLLHAVVPAQVARRGEIGRASCRDRLCQYV